MEILAFIYNLLLLLLYVFLVLISYSAYKKTKRKPYLYLALLGICFVLDLSFIFIYKFTNANNIKLYNNYRSILGFFTFFNYMMIFSKTINRKLNAFSFIPFITVIVVFYINNIAPNNIVACLFLKTCSPICLLEMCIIYFAHYLIYDDLETRNKIKVLIPFIKIMLITSVVGFVEGSLAVYNVNFFPEDIMQAFFYNCSVSDDIYSIFFSIFVFRHINRKISVINVFNFLSNDSAKAITQKEIDELKVENFSKKYQLNQREKEILLLIYQSNTNKEIANKLYLSEGTIKTYSYKICQKALVTNRNQLRKILDLMDVDYPN